MAPAPLTFGCASISTGGRFETPTALNELFTVLRDVGITRLDSAQLYGDCEVLLGKANVVAQPFAINGKSPGVFIPGSLKPEQSRADFHQTFQRLGVAKLDTYFIHGPDPALPIVPWLKAINSLHHKGRFARFGLSNFTVDQAIAVGSQG